MRKVFLFISIGLISFYSKAQTLPTGFNMSDVSSGSTWNQPVGATFTKDGLQLFVWEKAGRVYICNRQASGDYAKQSVPVVDIADEVGGWHDFGLVGFALDPAFASNGYIYLLYVVDRHHLMTDGLVANGYQASQNDYFKATIGRVTRYTTTLSGGNRVIISASRKILLGESKSTGIPILHGSHGVGSLAFAADGTLLITSGDGASFDGLDAGSLSGSYYSQALTDGIIRPEENVGVFRAQMLNSHSGKLLRINAATGDGVSSNPFYDAAAPRSAKSRVWAFGFRNPFRMSIKPGSGSTNPSLGDIGEVFIGDVGWNTFEELDIVKEPGTNYGWPFFEGLEVFAGYTNFDTENLDEPNVFGACNGRTYFRFKDLIREDNAAKDKRVYNPCDPTQLIGNHNRYINARPVIDWWHGTNGARVGRFTANGDALNTWIGTPQSGVEGVNFKGNCTVGGIWYTGAGNSFPPDYKNKLIIGDFADQWLRRLTIEYTDVLTKVEDFSFDVGDIVCLVENPLDGSLVCVTVFTEKVKKITFGGNMPPVAKLKADKYYGGNNLSVNFDATESYDPDGSIPVSGYQWDFGDTDSPDNTSSAINPNHTFSSSTGPKKFVVKLTVTDNGGVSTSEQFIVSVLNTPPVVSITSPEKNSKYVVGEDTLYDLKADVTDNEHNAAQLTYQWQTILKHNYHQHAEAINPKVETTSMISRIGCNGDDYHWMITLKVTDAAGLSTIDSSEIFPNCAGTLPIFLHKFSVTTDGTLNLVKWTTHLESNMEYFELERSIDGINFYPIDRQYARNNPGTDNYSYVDNGFSAGINYYRLKLVEHGSIIRYSVIIKTASGDEKNDLKIVPNPVTGNFSLTYTSLEEDQVIIEIKDITGKLLHTIKEGVSKGQNAIHIQSSPGWPGGVYFLSVKGKNDIRQTKFVKVQ